MNGHERTLGKPSTTSTSNKKTEYNALKMHNACRASDMVLGMRATAAATPLSPSSVRSEPDRIYLYYFTPEKGSKKETPAEVIACNLVEGH